MVEWSILRNSVGLLWCQNPARLVVFSRVLARLSTTGVLQATAWSMRPKQGEDFGGFADRDGDKTGARNQKGRRDTSGSQGACVELLRKGVTAAVLVVGQFRVSVGCELEYRPSPRAAATAGKGHHPRHKNRSYARPMAGSF